ncbi:hypothetical protein B0I35DRAFT_432473 [Stachybotrys elegans]|uniref:Secreted protein n=1 Tax=Stachybotrys elegans TaxID=80388 RepID=A0A8K0WS06_9HYPO|nr:hypothetical protein B0I35DRAFT_432473 [Stachybotrys elegans]
MPSSPGVHLRKWVRWWTLIAVTQPLLRGQRPKACPSLDHVLLQSTTTPCLAHSNPRSVSLARCQSAVLKTCFLT